MSEENKEISMDQLVDKDTAEKLGQASINRIKMIDKMAREYARTINGGTINHLEMFQVGMDTILAGFSIISRSNDYAEYDVDERITIINSALTTIIGVLNKVYLNPEVVAGQVAKASLESAKRKGIKGINYDNLGQ